MADHSDPSAKFELLQSDDFAQYLLRAPREIAFVLRQLAAHRCMITAYIDDSPRFMMSSVLSVSEDDHQLVLDVSRDETLNASVVAARQLLCVTQLEKVKIQFSISKFHFDRSGKHPALIAQAPQTLLRLQRREYYRLTAPVSHSLICRIQAPEDKQMIDARVVDISGGGVAVLVPPKGLDFSADQQYRNCRLDLPEFGPVTATLRVRNIFRITNPNGTEALRAGCQFEELPTAMANAIQRYILRVERDRKARDMG